MPLGRFVFYAATLGALLLAVRGIFLAPLPIEVSIGAVLSYVGIVMSGVLVLRLRVFADAVIGGPAGARGVALTFDDGPDPVWTRDVLDTLDRRGARATFFVIGRKAEAHADVVHEIVARGHTIGLHSYAHDRLFSLRTARTVRRDLERGIAVLERITGERPVLFRPPIGHTNPVIAHRAAAPQRTCSAMFRVSIMDAKS